jgi:3-deoxy-manno-octulosonate cytidylyltransferase (CMP-KDO synthetase)
MGWPRQDLAIIIPARLHSTRLPRKLLIEIAGRSVLEWTWRRARAAGVGGGVWIAWDSPEIAAAVREFGGAGLATGAQRSGTDRVAAAAELLSPPPRWVINLQGDEPLIEPEAIRSVAARLCEDGAAIVTAAAPLGSPAEWADPAVVKVVCKASGEALYFSRRPIPGVPRVGGEADFDRVREVALQHVGIYGFSLELLRRFVRLPPSPLAEIESLEQLRALEAGIPIQVVRLARAEPAVDTAADLSRVEQRLLAAAGKGTRGEGGNEQ